MRISLSFILLALCFAGQVVAQQTITSVKSGDWREPATWDLGRVPGDNDIIVVQKGFQVQIDKPVQLKNTTLRVIGDMTLARDVSLSLNSASVITVISGGSIRAKVPGDQSAILLAGAAKFRGSKTFNGGWGMGVVLGLAYAGSTTGNIDLNGTGFIFGLLPAVWQDLKLFVTPDDHVQMVWVTSHETARRSFHVERSREGSNWDRLGTIESAGSWSAQNIYNFVDSRPGSGQVFYRVLEVDPDGVIKYSSIRTVRLGDWQTFKIYPNPASGQVQVQYKKVEGEARMTMYNMLGQAVLSQVLPAGSSFQTLDISGLSNGVYAIRVTHEDGTSNDYRLVKH